MKKFAIIPVAACVLFLAGCSSDNPPPPVSKGQQLNDLRSAYDNKAIGKDDYKEERQKILDQ